MKEIQLTKGFIAIIDDEDFDRVNQSKWQAQKNKTNVYAARQKKIDGKYKKQYLHRFILNIMDGTKADIDHINHNSLDNRKENLRICTRSQNNMNARNRRKTISKYKGVDFFKSRNVFRSRIIIDGTHKHIGYFQNEVDAAKAYDINAKKHYGKYANLNFHD